MKASIYELLGMIKDGKAPKEIKSEGHYYIYNELEKDYYEGLGYDYEYLFKNITNDRLNDEVEIIEEKKIPEKLKRNRKIGGVVDNETYYEEKYDIEDIGNKLNEIIDYLKSKGE